MGSKELMEEASRVLMNNYARWPVVFVKGRGARLFDPEGRVYLDFVGGIAVAALGHCHRRVTVAIQKQAQRLLHVSNLYYIEPQIRLAKLLVEHSFADRVFFCNSGAEAMEAAIKLARKHSHDRHGPGRHEIIATENSFHGRTLATLSATGQAKLRKGFDPLVPGFVHVPYDDLTAVEKAISERTAAILVEPIQGEGGVRVPRDEYLPGLRSLCDRHGLLLILDEVQTGMGRTGTLFAYEHAGIRPDIMALAKALGNGVPIGAMLATEEAAQAFTPGTHASTFGGNPLASAAALATLETILEDGEILDHCRRMGQLLLEELSHLMRRHPNLIRDVRGRGLLVGIELMVEGKPIVQACLDEGVLVNVTAERVIRLAPPLTVTPEDIQLLIETLDKVLKPQTS